MPHYQNKRLKTDELIIKSMIVIAKQKGLNKVSVSDIITEAGINRSTFYRHFVDKYDLIEKAEQMLLNRIYEHRNRMLKEKHYQFSINNRMAVFDTLLTVIDNNRDDISFFMSEHGDHNFGFKMVELFLKMTYESWDSLIPNKNDRYKKMFAYYTAGSILSIIRLWLDHNDEYSKQDVLYFIMKIRVSELKNIEMD